MSSGIAAPPPLPADVTLVAPPSRHEGFIDQRLQQTRRQVKFVDVAVGLATLAVGVLLYLFLAAMLDHWIIVGGLGSLGRWMLWLVLVGAAGTFVALRIVPPLISRVNPVFAASTIEQSQPTLRNSLINFLLLRGRRGEMAQPVYNALESRAAEDLSRVHIETAVDRTYLIRISWALAALLALFLIYLVVSPKNPLRSASRILFPWSSVVAPTRATIEDVHPGDTGAFIGESITVSAEVSGLNEGETPLLIYSTADGQSVDQQIPMTQPEGQYRYECELPPTQHGLQQDYKYRLSAGDCRTREYTITVQSAPAIVVDKVVYHYPGYTGLADQTVERQADLRALAGTEVTIHAATNTDIKPDSAEIDLGCTGRGSVKMAAKDRSATGSFRLRLKPDGSAQYDCYQLRFSDADGNENTHPSRHNIEVVRDLPPELSVVEPREPKISVPENGRLTIRVRAEDPDFALRRVSLRAVRADGRSLSIRPLLEKLRPEKGVEGEFQAEFEFEPKRYGLKAGDRVEYWAEAEDNKEPDANHSATEKREILIEAPQAQDRQDNQEGEKGDRSDQRQENQPDDKQSDLSDESQDQRHDQSQKDQQPKDSAEEQGSDRQQDPSGEEGNERNQGEQSAEEQNGKQGEEQGDKQQGENQQGENQQGEDQQGEGQQGNNQEGDSQQGDQPGDQSEQRTDPNAQQGDAMQKILDDMKRQQKDQDNQDDKSSSDQQQQQPDQQSKDQQQGNQQPSENEPQNQSNEQQGGAKQNQPDQQRSSEEQPGGGGSEQQQGTSGSEQTSGQQQEQGASGGEESGDNKNSGNESATENREGGEGKDSKPSDTENKSDKADGESKESDGKNADGKQPGDNKTEGDKTEGEKKDGRKGPHDEETGKPQRQPSDDQQTTGTKISDPHMPDPDEKPKKPRDNPLSDLESVNQEKEPCNGSGNAPGQQTDNNNQPSDSNQKSKANPKGDTAGDHQGEGEEGGGRQSDQDGKGGPGASTAADEGASQAKEPGAGDAGSRPGEDEKAETPTGSEKKTPGTGRTAEEAKENPTTDGRPSDTQQQTDSTGPNATDKPSDASDASGTPQDEKDNTPGTKGFAPGGSGKSGPSKQAGSGVQSSDRANLEYAKRQTTLALEHLRDQLDKQQPPLLDKLGWTKDEARQFLERWEKMQRAAEQPGMAGKEAQQRFDDALQSLGLRPGGTELKSGGVANERTETQRDAGRHAPPPEWADLFRAYTRGISEEQNGEAGGKK